MATGRCLHIGRSSSSPYHVAASGSSGQARPLVASGSRFACSAVETKALSHGSARLSARLLNRVRSRDMSTSDDDLETTWSDDASSGGGDTDGTDAGDTDGEDGGDTDGTDTGDTDGTDTGDT